MSSDPLTPMQATGRQPPGRRRQRAGFLGAATLVCVLPAHAVDGVAADPISLTRTYHGSDGSVLSMRAVGNTVVGFGQDANGQRGPADGPNDMDMPKAAWPSVAGRQLKGPTP